MWWRVDRERRRSARQSSEADAAAQGGARPERRDVRRGVHTARSAIATPSQPLRSSVCSAVASNRGSRPSISRPALRADHVRGRRRGIGDLSPAPDVVDDDDRAGMPEPRGPVEVDRVGLLVGVDEDEIERLPRPRGSAGRLAATDPDVDLAGRPRRGRGSPGRSRRLRGSASIVTTIPSSGMPRAIQIVEYAPSVPISSTRRAPEMRASRCSSLPETGATSIARQPGGVLLGDRGLEVGVVSDERLGQVRVDAAPCIGCGFGHAASQPGSRPRVNRPRDPPQTAETA